LGDRGSTSSKQIQTAKGPNGTPITTKYIYPPISDRNFDWIAWYGEWDGDPQGAPDFGWGATEELAIKDLIDNYDEPNDNDGKYSDFRGCD